MMTTGFAGRLGPDGSHGQRLHRLQSEGNRNVPLCRLNDRFADGTPVQDRGVDDVTCKVCRRILAAARRSR